MDPNVWGKHGWIFLHSIVLAYPDKPSDIDKEHIILFFNSLKNVLPCDKCRQHFSKNLIKYPLDNNVISSKNTLNKWLIDIHNEVNIQTGKPTISYKDATDKILKMYKTRSLSKLQLVLIIIFFIIALIIILISQ